MGYTKLKTTLRDSNNVNLAYKISTLDNNVVGSWPTYTWGYFAGGNKYYNFATSIDGVTYGGVVSNEVLMTSFN